MIFSGGENVSLPYEVGILVARNIEQNLSLTRSPVLHILPDQP